MQDKFKTLIKVFAILGVFGLLLSCGGGGGGGSDTVVSIRCTLDSSTIGNCEI